MNQIRTSPNRPALRKWVLALACASLAAPAAMAMPYATSLTNNAGVVSFRLNQTTATNDTVLIISSGDTVTNLLLSPKADPANVLRRGLIVTNLGIAPGAFKVQIRHIGSGQMDTNSPVVAFNAPRGVAVNQNPASPYFGTVYVANSSAGSKGDGIFAFGSDLSDMLGQGATAKTGGYTGFGSSTSWSPYRISVAPDDKVLVCDDTDVTGGLIALDPLLTSYQYVLKQIQTNDLTGNAVFPVSSNNNHGSVAAAIIVGTGSSRVLYTIDEDYETDPTSVTAIEFNSVWKYNIGDATWPWSNAPMAKLMTPYIYNYAGQNQDLATGGPLGYLYMVQRRANRNQYGLYVVDPNNITDPSTYPDKGGYIWNSQDESHAEGWNDDDLLRGANGVAVSSDGKYIAIIYYGGDGQNQTNANTGEVWTRNANDVVLMPLTNGIPNLAQRTAFNKFGTTAAGRGLTFDAAHNLYVISSGHALLQSVDLGESGVATTDSAGAFALITPSTTVSVEATTPLAYEQGAASGVFTLTRVSPNLSSPLTVYYTISGTATNGVDYVTLPGQVTFQPGMNTATVTVTPVDDNETELTETVILTLSSDAEYSLSPAKQATVAIADNETPQLRITSFSTTMFEGNPYDCINLSLQRWGDTNVQVTVDTSNFSLSGTAVSLFNYYSTNLPATFDPGVVDKKIALLSPIDDGIYTGNKTINLTLLPGSGYVVTNNTATATLVDAEAPADTVLWSDNFNTDSSANWNVFFGATNADIADYTVMFGYDYSALGIPPAPHSTTGDTYGLFLTVNKQGLLASGAGLNAYPKGQNFSGNFALRFDMYLIENRTSGTTEHVIFGINHSGTLTNWFRNTGTGAPGYAFDGLWYAVEADGAGLGDYVLNSSPAVTNAGVVDPKGLASQSAANMLQVFKSPPWTPGALGGGAPANLPTTTTPSWAQVEISQIGNIVTLSINNSVVMSYTNATAYTSGDIMLGYDDAYDSIGNGSANAGDACVIYDNVRVVKITPIVPPNISIASTSGNIVITYEGTKLFSSPDPTLPASSWTQVSGAASPYTLPSHSAKQLYYRAQW